MAKKYDIRKIFEQMELDLISSMMKNLKRHESEERKEGFKFEQWQGARLRDMERFRAQNKAIIDEYSPAIERTIQETLMDSYEKGKGKVLSYVVRLKEKLFPTERVILPKQQDILIDPDDLKPRDGLPVEELKKNLQLFDEASRPLEDVFFRGNDEKLKTLIKTTTHDMAKAENAVLRQMDDVYRETMFKSQVYFNQGNVTLEQAVDMATKDFLGAGINCIEYKDGKRVNISTYAEMMLRTSNHRSLLMGQGTERQRLGITTVITSQHATSCPLCAPWQAKVLIDDVYSGGKKEDGDYPLLTHAIQAGFLHPQCQHGLNTFYPGINSIPTPVDSKRAIEWYNQAQYQRALERQIRAQKRNVAGTLDPEQLVMAKRKLRRFEMDLRNHLAENSQLRRMPQREKVRE